MDQLEADPRRRRLLAYKCRAAPGQEAAFGKSSDFRPSAGSHRFRRRGIPQSARGYGAGQEYYPDRPERNVFAGLTTLEFVENPGPRASGRDRRLRHHGESQ